MPRKVALLLLLVSGCLKIPAGESQGPGSGEQGARNMVSWPGKAPGDLYKINEARAFVLMQGGKPIGTSWGRYEGPVEGEPGRYRFTTRIELVPPQRAGAKSPPLRSAGEVILDEQGRVVRGFERSDAAELKFERQGDSLVFQAGRERDEIAYREGDAFMAFSAIFHEELMFGLRKLAEGELSWRLVSLSGSMPTEWSAKLQIVDAEHPGVALLKTSLGEQIHLRDGRIERIEIPADEVEIVVPAKPPAWPDWQIAGPPVLTYSPPADAEFTIRPLELPGQPGEPKLAGEVLVPKSGKGPFPAALFLSSTGQQDRHGFAGPPPVDLGSHAITDALAGAGFVVLRFDDRGFGESDDGPISYLGQLEDARRALRTLLVQDEVDPDRIVLVGHGEGGWRALTLSAEDKGIRAVALLAAPGRPYEAVLRAQSEAALESVPPAMRAEARKSQQKTLAALKTGKDVPPELAAQALWVREILQIKPEDLIATTPVPLWIAQGGKDFEIDPNADPPELMRLARRFRKKVEIKSYPDLDHLFKKEPGESTPARYLDASRAVDPAFLADLTGWLSGQVKAPAAPTASPGGRPRAR